MGLGEKKEVITRYISQGLRSRRALEIANMTRHQYYYQPKKGKRGRKPSSTTILLENGQQQKLNNQQVVTTIESIKQDPDLNYGYHAMTRKLQQIGYKINPKKTYRLMKENSLLQDQHRKSPRQYVKYRKVIPTSPLEVIEMDIKMIWVERERRQAFILNIIDTFNRKWLYQSVNFSITATQVKKAWEHIIVEHLQPNDCLNRDIHIEIRNDNDKRFAAETVQKFFKENHLNQVFTHPYTPQENAHVESFHAILSKRLRRFSFWSINELEQNLTLFMDKYNNVRIHGSLDHLSPNDFNTLWNQSLIDVKTDLKKRKNTFKLKIPRSQILQHSGNNEPEGCSSHKISDTPDKVMEENFNQKEMCGANISNNSRSKKSPSVVPRNTNIHENLATFENQK